MKHKMKLLLSIFFFALSTLLIGTLNAQEDLFNQIEERYRSILENSNVFEKIPSNIGGTEELITNVLKGNLSNILTINDHLISQHFVGEENPELAHMVERWGVTDIAPFRVPFFIDNSGGRYRIVVSSRLLEAPDSVFVFYITFFKAYQNIADFFKTKPSVITFGICSLIAQEVTYRTTMASAVDFDLESATVNLLYLFEPDIIWRAFPGPNQHFNEEAYRELVVRSLQKMNGGREEDQRKNAKNLLNWGIGEYDYRELLKMLPINDEVIDQLINIVDSRINNLTTKFLLINALYDRKTQICGSIEPRRWLYKMVQEPGYDFNRHTFRQGHPKKRIVDKINIQRQNLLTQFIEELERRRQNNYPIRHIAFDPFTVKWLVTYLYNYSLELAEKKNYFRQNGGTDEDIDERLIFNFLSSDHLLRQLFSIIGRPIIRVRNSFFVEKGKEVEFGWNFRRSGASPNNSNERIKFEIFDTFGSEGGKPVEGVYANARVIVRRSLQSDPMEIPVSHVQRGYLVMSVDQLHDISTAKIVWVPVIGKQVKRAMTIWCLVSGNRTLRVAPAQQVLGSKDGEAWSWRTPAQFLSNTDKLLGITSNTDQQPQPISLSRKRIVQNPATVVILILPKNSVGAYFAESRLVKAAIPPPVPGIEGDARIDTAEGFKMLRNLSSDDEVNAFEYCSPEAFNAQVDHIESILREKYVTISYKLPDGSAESLRVTEDQRVFVYTQDHMVTTLPASKLRRNQRLITAFRGMGEEPKTATITDVQFENQLFGFYDMTLRERGEYQQFTIVERIVRANGILVPVKYKVPAPQKGPPGKGYGGGSGGKGPRPGKIRTTKNIFETDLYQRRPMGVILDIDLPQPKIPFNKQDYSYFKENLRALNTIRWENWNLSHVDHQRLVRFLKKYYYFVDQSGRPLSNTEIYNRYCRQIYDRLRIDFETYKEFRALFLNSRDIRTLPGLINEYIYIAYLLYEAGERDKGDLFTKDILTIIMRTLSKKQGRTYYSEDKLHIRQAIIAIRDLLLYVRDDNQQRGLRPAKRVTFPCDGWTDLLSYFIKKQELSRDIVVGSDTRPEINLYNLNAQLDYWAGKTLTLPESILVDRFDPATLFHGDRFETAFDIKYIKKLYIK